MPDLRLGDMVLASGGNGVGASGKGTEVYTGEEVEWCQILTHAEVVRLHAWLAGWLAEQEPGA